MNSFAQVSVLSDEQIAQIREATEELFEKTGFAVMHAGLVRKAKAAGADVDEHSGRVRLPRPLFRDLLAQIPPRYTIRGVAGDTWEVGGKRAHGLAIVTDPWIIDYETQQPRRPCLEDVRRHTVLAQKLEPIAAISRMDFPVTDYDDSTSSLRALEMHLLHHTRHNYLLATTLESFEQWMDVLDILGRGQATAELLTSGIAMDSPLTLNALNADLLLRSVERGFRIVPTICPMSGTTAPYSLAGTLLQSNIEALAIGVMAQMLRPATPFLYTTGVSVADMRTGQDLYYTLDKVLWKAAGAQLGLSYGLPITAECGGTMTHRYDQQSGAEGMLFMLAAVACGAHMLAGFGSCHNANGMSAEMMVIHESYLKAAQFLGGGIKTDELRLAVSNIADVGPGGNFLTDPLTLELLRGHEFFKDDVFDLSGGYSQGGSLLERAHDRVEQLLSGYESPVPADIQEGLRQYFHDLYPSLGSGSGVK